MTSKEHTTTNHDEIRQWAEERNAVPSVVKGTEILRFNITDWSDPDELEGIEWEKFFQIFDDRELVFLYQEETEGGERSNFNKFIGKDSAEE